MATAKNPYASFTTSQNFEVEGIWLEEPDFRVKIARSGGKNRAYTKMLERLFRKHRRSIATNTISDKVATPLLAEAFVHTVIKGWQVNTGEIDSETNEPVWADGIFDPNAGEVVEATPDTMKAVLLHPKFGKDLFDYIREQSDNVSLFLEDTAETDMGN